MYFFGDRGGGGKNFTQNKSRAFIDAFPFFMLVLKERKDEYTIKRKQPSIKLSVNQWPSPKNNYKNIIFYSHTYLSLSKPRVEL